MRKFIPTLTLAFGAIFMLTANLSSAADEAPASLERSPFCRTFPSRCSGGLPPTYTTTNPDDERCAELTKHPAVVRREKRAWKTPIDAAGEAALQVWDTTCRDWRKRNHRWDMDATEQRRAWSDIERTKSDAEWERSERRYRNRIDCVSTWDHYPYSSRLTTTCTSY